MINMLTVDIGNTIIKFGVFSGDKISFSFKVNTGNRRQYKIAVNRLRNKDISKIVLCSVVPKEALILKALLKNSLKQMVYETSKEVKVPIINRYEKPRQVGQDRLVNAYAGLKLFGGSLILVDFGTAITFDVVSKKGDYLGGLIFPGLDLSLDALHRRTALLPRIKIKKPKTLIGLDTASSINNGIIIGMAGVCDGVISRLHKKFKGYKVIATGGGVNFIKKFSTKIKTFREDLTLEGLRLIAEQI